jgi:hypothetical protein
MKVRTENTEEQAPAPKAGTPEYDEQVVAAHDASVDDETTDVEEQDTAEEAEQPELPEGVSLADLIAMHKKQQEDAPDNQEEDADEPADSDTPEETTSEDDSEVESLRKRLKDIEDNQTMNDVYNSIGGEGNFNELKKAAEDSLSETELSMFNSALVGGSTEEAVAATKLLQRVIQSNPDAPNFEGERLSGEPTIASSNTYATEEQLNADMANPLYFSKGAAGEQFRQQVESKLSRSKLY